MKLAALIFAGVLAAFAGPTRAADSTAAAAQPSAETAPKALVQASQTPPPPRITAPDTIMFTIDELTEIRSRASVGGQKSGGDPGPRDTIEGASLYLSTIMYYGPDDWTIWVNGVPISPGQEFQAFKIGSIKPSYVELMVPLSAAGMRPVRLSPNQTFVVNTGAVIEGPWR